MILFLAHSAAIHRAAYWFFLFFFVHGKTCKNAETSQTSASKRFYGIVGVNAPINIQKCHRVVSIELNISKPTTEQQTAAPHIYASKLSNKNLEQQQYTFLLSILLLNYLNPICFIVILLPAVVAALIFPDHNSEKKNHYNHRII